MEALWGQFLQVVGKDLPGLVYALAILLIGWLVAALVAGLVRGVFKQTGVDAHLARWISPTSKAGSVSPGRWVANGVYYILLLLVFVAFFQTLGLTIVTEPLNQVLVQISDFAPRILSAILLLMIAWILARIIKTLIIHLMTLAKVEERLGESTGRRGAKKVDIAETTGNVAYWLVFLLFLSAILDALALQGLLMPVTQMLNKVLGFLPNLVAAAVIFVVGWFAGRIVQQIVTNLLRASGIDQASEQTGLSKVLGNQTLSDLAGLVVYALILIPVAIASLDALQIDVVSAPAAEMLKRIFNAIPAVFTAGLVLLVSYLVGRFAGGLVSRLLAGIGFNNVVVRLGIGKEAKKSEQSPAEIAGFLVTIAIILFAAIEAASLVGFALLADILVQFIGFAGQLLLGVLIFGLGLYLANLASGVIQKRAAVHGGVLAMAARVSIIILAAAMALQEMGLASKIIQMAFALLFGSVAVSVALAFGLGSRQIAAKEVEHWVKSLKGS